MQINEKVINNKYAVWGTQLHTHMHSVQNMLDTGQGAQFKGDKCMYLYIYIYSFMYVYAPFDVVITLKTNYQGHAFD